MATATKPAQSTSAEHRARVHEILEDARFVMMFTRGHDGELHGRPMSIARVSDDGTLYFSTSVDSAKVRELTGDTRVDLAFQSRTQYCHVAATARVIDDRALVHELWKEDWKLWYPQGKDDPQIRIVVVDPISAEYWDLSGMRGLSFVYRAAKAYVKGEEMETQPQDHGKVQM